ncbi:MAG TPA: PEP-CTERM sorting domain-containing protein [Fimbriimonadaceae bacterium]|nr:PEP-CTERM sorting domain-containing protein [Fimbriimonadaceae bacterium]HRJ97937.1 PEP-CTERM sorting domain-containing protein [Fimbriimonadaceae bacterium]
MKTRVLILLLSSLTALSHAQVFQPRSGVQFYFSDAGGTSERLTTDLVTGPNWTGEYDVYAKNSRQETIQFDAGLFMVGYAQSLGYGTAASPIPGSDKVTVFDVGASGVNVNVSPNITGRASWLVGDERSYLVGGFGPSFGTLRSYGLNVPLDPVQRIPIQIASGESLFLARIKFRDNGLFAGQGFHDLVLYDYPQNPNNFACSSLFSPNAPVIFVYHDGPNWEGNSRLRLYAVPEPATLGILGVSIAALLSRRNRRP